MERSVPSKHFPPNTGFAALQLELQHRGSWTDPGPGWRVLCPCGDCVEGLLGTGSRKNPRPSASPTEQGPTVSPPVCPPSKPQMSPALDPRIHLTCPSGRSSGRNCAWSRIPVLHVVCISAHGSAILPGVGAKYLHVTFDFFLACSPHPIYKQVLSPLLSKFYPKSAHFRHLLCLHLVQPPSSAA